MRLTRFWYQLLPLLALLHAASCFMCYTRGIGSDYTGVTFCFSGSCFSRGGSLGNEADSEKGCTDGPQQNGCLSAGIPGILSGHTCICNSFLCNSAPTAAPAASVLVLPGLLLLHRLLL